MMHPRAWIGLGLVIGGTVGACYHYDPNYCGNQDGHASCRERGLGQFCSLCDFEKDGCVDARPSDHCLAPFDVPGESSESSGSGSDTGVTTTMGVTSDATDGGTSGSSSGGGPCSGPEDCSGATPFCDPAGECVGCGALADGDAACAGLDPSTPLCVGGGCVACTEDDTSICDAQLRLCDPVSHQCVDCTEHGLCDSGACQLDVGTCFPGDSVVHVDGDGGQDFASVSAAVDGFANGALGVIVLHERGAAIPYTESLVVDGGKVLAVVAAPDERPIVQGTGAPAFTVQGAGTTLYLERLTISGGSAFGLVCDGTRVDARRSRIIQNSGGGILVVGGGELSVENSFIGGPVDTDALDVQSSSAAVLYSTLAASAMIAGEPTALQCSGPAVVDVRNSILVGASTEPEVQCSGVTVAQSATEDGIAGPGNAAVGPFQAGWFNGFVTG
ncbi:MAG: hypothetical protein KDK70_36495, partial [Myxococcales bacterium]|nr:hypothetical protein [Myxococcales bacterium]